jgi:flagellar protein FlbD
LPHCGAGQIAVLSAGAVALYTTAIGPFPATFNSFRNYFYFLSSLPPRACFRNFRSRFFFPLPITLLQRRPVMIELTRLNGHPIIINAELIKFVEQNPDTVITLVTGDKMVVREAAPEVMHRVLDYRRNLLHPDAPLFCADSGHGEPTAEPSAQK